MKQSVTEGTHPASAGVRMRAGINVVPGSHDDGWVEPQPVTLTDGTHVKLYKDGEALDAARRAIERAQRRICLEVYIFGDDATGRAFADLLSEKARQGVRVFLVYDSFGSIGSDREMFRKMKRAGVRVEEFHPVRPWDVRFSWRPFNRDHRKLLLVDDDTAWMGGLNIAGEYAGSWIIQSSAGECDFWRDTAVGIEGPSSRYFLRAFAATWAYLQHGGRIKRAEYAHGVQAGRRWGVLPRGQDRSAPMSRPSDLGVLASVATMDSPLRPLLKRLFAGARERIELTMAYFAPDDELIDSLCDASRRGVRVRLMLPDRCDVPAVVAAARSFYEKLMSYGVEIYERQNVILHAKTMVIDRRTSIVGSANLDYRSIEYNCELSSIVRSDAFGSQMSALFENDVMYSNRIDLKEWRRRPYLDRMVQWMTVRARYLL